jgi:hypothetical protein
MVKNQAMVFLAGPPLVKMAVRLFFCGSRSVGAKAREKVEEERSWRSRAIFYLLLFLDWRSY